MTYHVVTTCHAQGWKIYGRRMVRSHQAFWPKEVKLTLYAEGFEPDLACDMRKLPSWVDEFKARHAKNTRACGYVDHKPYNMLFDAVRFCHKVGAVIDAAQSIETDTLIWVDADVVTHAPVTMEFLDGLWGDTEDPGIAWLNRVHKYPECGFVMYYLGHERMKLLMTVWRMLYVSDHVFKMVHWTDCHTLEASVLRTEMPTVSLSGNFTNVGHPFINGPLGAVMDHMKGERKFAGRSRRGDLRTARQEPYWKGVR